MPRGLRTSEHQNDMVTYSILPKMNSSDIFVSMKKVATASALDARPQWLPVEDLVRVTFGGGVSVDLPRISCAHMHGRKDGNKPSIQTLTGLHCRHKRCPPRRSRVHGLSCMAWISMLSLI